MCLRALSCLTFFARSPRDPRADERTKPLPRAHKKRSIQWSYERERYFTHLQRRIARIRIDHRFAVENTHGIHVKQNPSKDSTSRFCSLALRVSFLLYLSTWPTTFSRDDSYLQTRTARGGTECISLCRRTTAYESSEEREHEHISCSLSLLCCCSYPSRLS